jgi:hypothetical protein
MRTSNLVSMWSTMLKMLVIMQKRIIRYILLNRINLSARSSATLALKCFLYLDYANRREFLPGVVTSSSSSTYSFACMDHSCHFSPHKYFCFCETFRHVVRLLEWGISPSRRSLLVSFNDTSQHLYYLCDTSYLITNGDLGETWICLWLFKAQCLSFLKELRKSWEALTDIRTRDLPNTKECQPLIRDLHWQCCKLHQTKYWTCEVHTPVTIIMTWYGNQWVRRQTMPNRIIKWNLLQKGHIKERRRYTSTLKAYEDGSGWNWLRILFNGFGISDILCVTSGNKQVAGTSEFRPPSAPNFAT